MHSIHALLQDIVLVTMSKTNKMNKTAFPFPASGHAYVPSSNSLPSGSARPVGLPPKTKLPITCFVAELRPAVDTTPQELSWIAAIIRTSKRIDLISGMPDHGHIGQVGIKDS